MQSAEGAVQDKESILSIRAGTSRRQGAVEANKAIHFPVSIAEAQPFKVDFLRQVCAGETTVPITGWESLTRTVELQPPGAAGEKDRPAMRLDLRIAAKPQICGRSRGATAAAAMKSSGPEGKAFDVCDNQEKTAVQVGQYFDDHNMKPVVQALLEAIVREKPADPRDFIAQFMESVVVSRDGTFGASTAGLTAALEPKPMQAAKKEGDAPNLKRERTLQDAFQRHNPSRSDGCLDEESFCTAIRDVHPCLSAEQARVLGKGVAPGGEGITFAAFCAAADAVAADTAVAAEVAGLDVKTFASLGSTTATQTDDAQAKTFASLGSTTATQLELAGAAERPADDIQQLREKCASTLLKVCKDGRLEEVLTDVVNEPQPVSQLVPRPTAAGGAAAAEKERQLKAKVRKLLISAEADGSLEKELQKCAGRGSFAPPAFAPAAAATAPATRQEAPPAPSAEKLPALAPKEPPSEAAGPAAQKAAVPMEPFAAASAPSEASAPRTISPGLLERLNTQSELMARQTALVDELRDLTERLTKLQQANMAATATRAALQG